MQTVTTRGRKVQVPEFIDELTPKQYERYIRLAFALSAGFIDDERFRVLWFSYLIGMGTSNYTMLRHEYIAELEAQREVIDGFFVSREGIEGKVLDFNTPVNLLPECKGYKGPGDWLRGLTFGEFVECLTVQEGLAGLDPEGIEEGCDHIARVLYHIPEAEKVPDLIAFHAPTFFAAVCRFIQAAPIDINGKKIDFRIIFQSSGTSKPDDKTGWTGITFEIAKDGLFGTAKEVEATDMWDILLYLYRCKFEYNNEKRKNKT